VARKMPSRKARRRERRQMPQVALRRSSLRGKPKPAQGELGISGRREGTAIYKGR
jgi:hypothetical protein